VSIDRFGMRTRNHLARPGHTGIFIVLGFLVQDGHSNVSAEFALYHGGPARDRSSFRTLGPSGSQVPCGSKIQFFSTVLEIVTALIAKLT
jgi:hypothetical protein